MTANQQKDNPFRQFHFQINKYNKYYQISSRKSPTNVLGHCSTRIYRQTIFFLFLNEDKLNLVESYDQQPVHFLRSIHFALEPTLLDQP